MGYTLKVKNDRNEILNLSASPNYTVSKIEGLNPPQATINSSVNTTTDGSKINSTRLESRNIVIYVVIEGDIEANRINLYKYFPCKKNVTLYFTNGARNVFIEGMVEIIECDLFSNKQVAQISLICPKPYFKAVYELVSYFSTIDSLFQFPFSMPDSGVEISALVNDVRKKIINVGDVQTGIIIELFAIGTVVNPILYDVLKRTSMSLNFTMQPSDKIVINTNVGEKSITLIRNGVSTNALGYMKPNSKWFMLENGDNIFTYDCENGINNLQLTFTSAVLYSGV